MWIASLKRTASLMAPLYPGSVITSCRQQQYNSRFTRATLPHLRHPLAAAQVRNHQPAACLRRLAQHVSHSQRENGVRAAAGRVRAQQHTRLGGGRCGDLLRSFIAVAARRLLDSAVRRS